MRLTLEGGTNTEYEGMFFSAKSVPILQFNVLALRGEFHPHTSSYFQKDNSILKKTLCTQHT